VDTPDFFFEGSELNFTRQGEIAARRVGYRRSYYECLLEKPIRSVLEIGCGHGAWKAAWESQGVDYTGIEYLPEVAEWARNRTGGHIITGDFLEHKTDDTYDVIFCSQVLEHVGRPDLFLQKASKLADVIHLDVPNHSSATSDLRKLFHRTQYGFIQPNYHLRAYTPRSLRAVLERNGFDVVKSAPIRNDHPALGQLFDPSRINKMVYLASSLIQKQSLLVGVGKSVSRD
jgi:SAM-dependent methyltransferase